MKLQNKKGFTLIELLVVITIIGILATGATTVYTSQIQKARDTTRINDVKALQSAVEQVYQDGWEYPHSNEFDNKADGWVTVVTYMPKLPRDPKDGQTCNKSGKTTALNSYCMYSYNVWSDENGIAYWRYVLSTWFEAQWKVESDWDRDGWKHKWRWEVWNGIIWTTKLDNDIENDWCKNIPKTTKWVKSSTCTDTLPAEWLITIHGS